MQRDCPSLGRKILRYRLWLQVASGVAAAMQLEGEGQVDKATHQLLDQLLVERFKHLDEDTRRMVLAKAGLVLAKKQ